MAPYIFIPHVLSHAMLYLWCKCCYTQISGTCSKSMCRIDIHNFVVTRQATQHFGHSISCCYPVQSRSRCIIQREVQVPVEAINSSYIIQAFVSLAVRYPDLRCASTWDTGFITIQKGNDAYVLGIISARRNLEDFFSIQLYTFEKNGC